MRLQPWRKRRRDAVVVFVQLPTLTPETTTGDDEPIIGVVESEAEAERIAAQHPQDRIRWETVSLHSEQEALPSTLLVGVQGGFFEEIADRSPSPLAVFTTAAEARAWARRRRDGGPEVLLFEVPCGTIDLSAPAWPRRFLSEPG